MPRKAPCKGGIYRITLLVDGRTYVGQTSKTFHERWRKHRSLLKAGTHYNAYLQSAWNKYGSENFEFAILEPVVRVEDLSDAESRWMSLYGATDRTRGFNLSGDTQGRISVSEETRKKLSQILKLKLQRPPANLADRRFGHLVVLQEHHRKMSRQNRTHIYWKCICDCGCQTVSSHKDLMGGKTTSCGCKKKERIIQQSTTHGHGARTNKTITYNAWRGMADRGRQGQYEVCQEWLQSFESFLADMGEKPSKEMRLVRHNPELPFGPNNCFWGSIEDCARKISSVKNITYNGETHCMEEWSRKLGISHSVISWRLKQGWPPERILAPVIKTGSR